jgi:hypothetical protein
MECPDIHVNPGREWNNYKVEVCDVSKDAGMAAPMKTEGTQRLCAASFMNQATIP